MKCEICDREECVWDENEFGDRVFPRLECYRIGYERELKKNKQNTEAERLKRCICALLNAGEALFPYVNSEDLEETEQEKVDLAIATWKRVLYEVRYRGGMRLDRSENADLVTSHVENSF